MLTLTTSLVLFLSTVTASPASTAVSPTIIDNQQVVQAATTSVPAAVALPIIASDEKAEATSTDPNANVEARVRAYFADEPILIKVARCESRFKQFTKTGDVMRGIVTADVGVMQVNEYYHGKTAEKMGIDLHSLEGNLAYARYLYDKEGTSPWSASEYCWSK